MASTRDRNYTVRLSMAEYIELKSKAKKRGVDLADAFREGAKMYLSQDGEVTEALSALDAAVKKAQEVLVNSQEEK